MTKPRVCQQCQHPITPDDQAADFYADVCQSCWNAWLVEYREAFPGDEPPSRYGTAGQVRNLICAACGQGFGGVFGFDRHRYGHAEGWHCRRPAEIGRSGQHKIAKGVWVRISERESPAWMPVEGCPSAIPGDLVAGEYQGSGSAVKTPENASGDAVAP